MRVMKMRSFGGHLYRDHIGWSVEEVPKKERYIQLEWCCEEMKRPRALQERISQNRLRDDLI